MSPAKLTRTLYLRASIILAVALALTPLSARAQDATSAQGFVQSNVENALQILQSESLAPQQKREQLHTLLLSVLDAQRIAMYTLGQAQTTANPTDLAAFTDAFREFLIANFGYGLNTYSGRAFNVIGSTQRAPNDFVVSTLVVDRSGSANGKAPSEVDFRILYEGGKYAIVDASVRGVWLAVAQHDDFQSFLADHNGDLAALTAHLKQMTDMIAQRIAAY
jgi:phospholipid transport system substrate-binding protein